MWTRAVIFDHLGAVIGRRSNPQKGQTCRRGSYLSPSAKKCINSVKPKALNLAQPSLDKRFGNSKAQN